MNLPQAFIERTRQLLGDEAYTQFEEALQTETPVSIRPNRMKCSQPVEGEPIPWASSGSYLNNRPTFTFDPLFHAGCYYVQEASSMFVERVLQEYVKELSTLILRHDVYIEPSIKTELSNMERWYRELILALDVFRQTEADERLDVPAEFQEAKMRFECNLAGTAVQAAVNAFSERLERILSEKLRHPRLRYWYDDKDYSPEYDSFSSSQLVTKSSMLGVLFLFVHVSQWYSRDEFDELEENAVQDCIECGCCLYSCPANIPLLDLIRIAKGDVIRIIRGRAAKK